MHQSSCCTGLRRGEFLALRWREVDFAGRVIRVHANYAEGELTTPKSGKVRSVPMAPDVATALAALGQADAWTGVGHPSPDSARPSFARTHLVAARVARSEHHHSGAGARHAVVPCAMTRRCCYCAPRGA
jgi:integrase